MQFMPKTANWVLEQMGSDEDYSPTNPDQQVRMADWYLNDYLMPKFIDSNLALAAYNWGEGNVMKAMGKHGYSWEDIKNVAPKETRDYVDRVERFAKQYREQNRRDA